MMSIHSWPVQTAQPAQNLPVYDAKMLTEDGDLAHIVLHEQVYTLRITRLGKLILTK